MRSTAEALQAFETTVGRYLIELESFDMEQLIKKPNEEEWSIGQMYMHLIQSAQFMHLHNVDQCLAGSAATVDAMQEKTERGKGAFELGSFPPVRIQVPASPQYTPKQPESKEQLKESFLGIVERMKNTESTLSKVPESRKNRKILHPGFGALNANEWFLLIEMHYRHHLSQLERLKQFLGNNA
ncbi:DinB family protein [Paenibacillus chondroitinus]|uniref:DinB family protein n=1 Tax=Paenibacillus chondroitinus TaxID=59842 RepID=A0ABU6DCD5_9BACL|nr:MULTISPECIES: DinB family protein [Paenibacillus]MCY9659962.1 DinB family protein [Paenibacillus anseongense]MEB4795420.1 DinB family protein [Paenibacillus chondroitinus]